MAENHLLELDRSFRHVSKYYGRFDQRMIDVARQPQGVIGHG